MTPPPASATEEVPPCRHKTKRMTRSHWPPKQTQKAWSASPKPSPVFSKARVVSIIGAHTFAMVCNRKDTQLFTLSFSPKPIEINSLESSAKVDTADSDLSSIPSEYHEFKPLFSKREAEKLPPHQFYDHSIPLEPGTTPPHGSIYSMSPLELETLRKYVEENLNKGFIRHSQSPCGVPVLFVKKSDGTLRLCVDYPGLNKITTKNRYPLPLIGEMLDPISRAKFFTKMDVQDGYNCLCMAVGEE